MILHSGAAFIPDFRPAGQADRVFCVYGEPDGSGSYVLQKVRCGKPSCRCARTGGKLHGPYWYLYWKKDGKTKSRYVGKEKPTS